nr:T9SS type A sorting domain-containing protein [Candidatus Neomarinimicrobiota bacterium]
IQITDNWNTDLDWSSIEDASIKLTVTKSETNTKLYINGELSATGPVIDNPAGDTFYLGVREDGSGKINAVLDKVAVWDVELSEEAVTALLINELNATINVGNYESSGDLNGYWMFDEKTGFLEDLSGNNNQLDTNFVDIGFIPFGTEPVTYYIVVDSYHSAENDPPNRFRLNVTHTVPPVITGFDLAEDNSYVDITFNKNTYTYFEPWIDDDHSLLIVDFEISNFQANGGPANVPVINAISNSDGDPLEGGELTVRLSLDPNLASGIETFEIKPATSTSIYDGGGTPMADTTTSGIITLNPIGPPTVSFDPVDGDTLSPINAEIKIIFDEPIFLYPSGWPPDTILGGISDSTEKFFNLFYPGSPPDPIPFEATINSDDSIVTIIPSLPLIERSTVLLKVNANVLQDTDGILVNQTNASFHVDDITSPEINRDLCSLSTNNHYIILSFSEGVYTDINSSGFLDPSDFELEFFNNGGNTDSVSMNFLAEPGLTGQLEGEEDSIWVVLEVHGPPDGTETIIIWPNTNEIYDSYNNPMIRPVVAPPPMYLHKEPWLKEFSLDEDNGYVDLTFSEGIFSATDASSPVNIGYFQLLEPEVAVISALTNTSDSALVGGEETIRVRISLSNPPATGIEEIEIKPYNDISICNFIGNRLSESNGTTDSFSLFDRLAPTITAVNIPLDTVISLTTSEGISNISSVGINTTDFNIEFYKNNEFDSTATDVYFTDIRDINGDSLTGNNTTVFISFETIGGPATGLEEIAISPASPIAIFDQAGNPMPDTTVSERIYLPDMFPPKFVPGSASIASDNSYVIFTLTEGVYSHWDNNEWEPLTPAQPSDFVVVLIPDEDDTRSEKVDTIIVDYITNSRTFPLIGGEDTLRCYLVIRDSAGSATTPTGHERLFIKAGDSTVSDVSRYYLPNDSIWSPDKATDTLQLFDQLVPGVATISIENDSTISSSIESPIALIFSEPIQSFEYTISARHYNYLSYIADTTATGFTITLQPPLASLDTITLSIFNLTDNVGLTLEAPLYYDFYTPPLGDYNIDGKVNVEDLAQFVSFWMANSQPTILGLGPTSGTYPHLVPELDANYDLDDGMTFIRMWSWSLERWGLEPLVASNIGTAINWDKLVVDVPIEAIAGQVYLRYDPNQGKVDLQHSAFGNNNFTLKKELADHGEVLLEFGLVEPNDDTKLISIKSEINEPAEATVIYKFFAKDRSLITAGTQKIALTIPTEFWLMQNYPNPFNNTTTIRYSVPEETDIQLEIFDINGRLVETLISQLHQPGFYDLKWSGRRVASGIYFLKLEATKTVLTQKMILLK